MISSFCQGNEFILNELFTERRNTVYEHLTVEMVELMLHNPGQIALYPLVVVLELFIVPLHMDTRRAHHLLMDGWQ